MTDFVLDNSVTMRWCFEGGRHPYADKVLNHFIVMGAQALVPPLWRYEVVSVLARAERTGTIDAAVVTEFLLLLASYAVRVDEDGGSRIFTDVRRLAIEHGLTGYDAAYLELALRRNLPMATLDAELIAACRTGGVRLV